MEEKYCCLVLPWDMEQSYEWIEIVSFSMVGEQYWDIKAKISLRYTNGLSKPLLS